MAVTWRAAPAALFIDCQLQGRLYVGSGMQVRWRQVMTVAMGGEEGAEVSNLVTVSDELGLL